MERGSHRSAHYDSRRERAHHLGILIGQGVTAWVAHDVHTAEPEMLAWSTGSDALHDADLPTHPRSVSFVSLPEWSTLVPDGAMAPENAKQHLTLVHGALPNGVVRDEPVQTLGATCLYVHDASLEQAVLERFPNARAIPLQAILVRGAQLRSGSGAVVLVHRGAERADITVACEQRILLSNSYPARTAEDLLYFCLLAAEQCGLRPETVPLRVGGTHVLPAERTLLQRFFADQGSAFPLEMRGTRSPEAGPLDRWFAAMDQFACVS